MFGKKTSSDKSKENALEDRENLLVILVGLTFALLGYFVSDLLFPLELKVFSADMTQITLFSHQTSIFFKSLLTLTFFLLGAFSSAYFIEHLTRKRKSDDIAKSINAIHDRLNSMAEHVAFHTEDGVIERNVINILRSKADGVMWIVARFISKQLSKSFSTLKFEIDGDDYSVFSEKLYRECSKSIYLTSPFTPAEWFRQLYPDKADIVFNMIDKGEHIEEYAPVPAHVQALVNADAELKKRLVIIPSQIMPSLIAQEKLLLEFLRIHPNIDTRFVEKEVLCEKYCFAGNGDFDFAKYDYAVFDREILLKWERPIKSKQKCPLSLIDLLNIQDSHTNEICKQIVDEIFEFKTGQHMTDTEMLNSITLRKEEKLRRPIIAKSDLPHKYAYYTTGAISWDKVANDTDYSLGRRELSTLSEFLRESFVQTSLKDNAHWNILHIGSGNGKEIPDIVSSSGVQWIRNYALLDVSPELLQIAATFGRKNFPTLNILTNVFDVTDKNIRPIADDLKNDGASRNLICIVANGAILSNSFVLKSIRHAMERDDILIITLETYDEIRKEEIFDQYKLASVVNLLMQPLSLIGIEGDDVKNYFIYSYNDEQSLIEVSFTFKDWISQHQDKKDSFTSFPDVFRIFASLRPPKGKLQEILEREGFQCEIKDIDREHCCGAICRVT